MPWSPNIRGFDKLAVHVPDLRAERGPLVGFIGLVIFAIATVILLTIDHLWPTYTGLGQIGAIIVGFLFAARFFWRRKAYRARWGDLAYRNAFGRCILPGMPTIMAAIVHTAYLPGDRLPWNWAHSLLFVLAAYLLVVGLLLWARSVLTFGIDNLAMLYVYFPDESPMVDASIYSVIRHPVYSAVSHVGMALGFWRGTWFSIAFGLLMPVGLTIWLRLVEEPELLERFADSYAAYRRKVPAFWPRLQDWGKFFRFLMTGR